MAHATEDRLVRTRDGNYYRDVPVAANVNVPTGTLGAVNSSGQAGPVADGTFERVLGLVENGADNTGGLAAAKTVHIRRHIAATFTNDAVAPVTAAHIGQTATWADNQTVSAPGTADQPEGGIILGFNEDSEVEVYFP